MSRDLLFVYAFVTGFITSRIASSLHTFLDKTTLWALGVTGVFLVYVFESLMRDDERWK